MAEAPVWTDDVYCILREWDAESAALIRRMDAPSFVVLKVKPADAPKIRRSLDAAWSKHRFREALLGHG